MNPTTAVQHRKPGTRSQLRRLLGLLATAAALGVVGGLTAPVPEAAAHSDLTASNPAAGSRVPVPAEIQLTFTGAVEPRFTTVTLAVDDAPAATLANQVSGATVTATPNRATVNATEQWRVAYRVVSQDGHPITGDFTFTVSGTATTTPVPVPPPPSGTPSTNPGSPETSAAPPSAPQTSSPTPADPSVQAGYPADTDHHPEKGQWGFIAIMSGLLLVVPVMAGLFRFLPNQDPNPVVEHPGPAPDSGPAPGSGPAVPDQPAGAGDAGPATTKSEPAGPPADTAAEDQRRPT